MKNNIQNNIEFLLALKLKFKLNSKQFNSFKKHEKRKNDFMTILKKTQEFLLKNLNV